MYLSHIYAENFRIFGSANEGAHLDLTLRPGMNIIVGENDAGKSGILDAVRVTLGTTTHEFVRLSDDDFHVGPHGRADALRIICTFSGLTDDEQAHFLEHLTLNDDGGASLEVYLDARRRTGRRVARNIRTGGEHGGVLDDSAREYLESTYLRALRDAESALTGGRNSRLAQLLEAHPNFNDEGTNDFDAADLAAAPKTLVGLMRRAEHDIKRNDAIVRTQATLNRQYLSGLSIERGGLTADMGVSREADLRLVLEKFDLGFGPATPGAPITRRGLGLQNALFMAAELLLLGDTADRAFPLLLIEEPEAHLHPQMQLQVAAFLNDRATRTSPAPVQVILTTHSPTLASTLPVEAMSIVVDGGAYSLAVGETKLALGDYRFLSRFLDATKANLFFARGVVIVEGDGEQLLIPALAELLGVSFTKLGISVVNVGSRGLFRYARIFQRAAGREMPLRVACIADRDIPPRSAAAYVKAPSQEPDEEPKPYYEDEYSAEALRAKEDALRDEDGGPVRTFVSTRWTLEYDLAHAGLGRELHVAIAIAKKLKNGNLTAAAARAARAAAGADYDAKTSGLDADATAAYVYRPLKLNNASKAETAQILATDLKQAKMNPFDLAQRLPSYLLEAIAYAARAE